MHLLLEAQAQHLTQVKVIFREYADSLDFDLNFQNFDQELANLPGEYAAPEGCILLAQYNFEIVGCVALRKFAPGIAEMKRLYVKPDFQGLGIGRALSLAVIEQARQKNYNCIRLDTIQTMKSAQALYLSLGFRMIEAYRENPIPGAAYFELTLGRD